METSRHSRFEQRLLLHTLLRSFSPLATPHFKGLIQEPSSTPQHSGYRYLSIMNLKLVRYLSRGRRRDDVCIAQPRDAIVGVAC